MKLNLNGKQKKKVITIGAIILLLVCMSAGYVYSKSNNSKIEIEDFQKEEIVDLEAIDTTMEIELESNSEEVEEEDIEESESDNDLVDQQDIVAQTEEQNPTSTLGAETVTKSESKTQVEQTQTETSKPVEEVKPTPTPDPVPTPEPTPTPDPVPTPDPEPSKSHLDPYAVVDRAVNELGFCRASTSAFTNWMGCDGTWAENEVSVGVTSGNGLNVAIMYFDDTSTSNFYQILRFALPSAQYLIDKLNDSSFWGGELTIDGHKVLVETPDYGVSVTIYQ